MQELFPYKPRENQFEIIKDTYNVIEKSGKILIHAPTGLGKTICSLIPAIYSGKKVFFLTTRQTQHNIVLQTCEDINNNSFYKEIMVADIKGKKSMCNNKEIKNIVNFYDACGEAKENEKELAEETFEKFKKNDLFCEFYRNGTCDYYNELKKAKIADVVIMDYSQIFNPRINKKFQNAIGYNPKETILIIDEAHNLEKKLREYPSFKITKRAFEKAEKEIKKYLKNNFLKKIIIEKKIFFDTIKEGKIQENECMQNSITQEHLKKLKEEGKIIKEIKKKREEIKAPRTSLDTLYNFFTEWEKIGESDKYLRQKINTDLGWEIKISCHEPKILSKPIFNKFFSIILMSGTLEPGNYHKKILGLEDAETRIYPSIFPKENRKIHQSYTSKLTTAMGKRSENMWKNYGNVISGICKKTEGNVAVFFPSYSIMNEIKKYILTDKEKIIEEKNQKIDIIKELEKKPTLLLAVMRGKYGEGVDYKNNLLKSIVIVGFPYPYKDLELAEREKYYNKYYKGKGFIFTQKLPAENLVKQAVGRGIRSEVDKCDIYLVDYRLNKMKWEK